MTGVVARGEEAATLETSADTVGIESRPKKKITRGDTARSQGRCLQAGTMAAANTGNLQLKQATALAGLTGRGAMENMHAAAAAAAEVTGLAPGDPRAETTATR